MYGCSPSLSSLKGTGNYHEDVSAHRPTFDTEATDSVDTLDSVDPVETVDVDPEFDVTAPLNKVLDSLAIINKGRKSVDGFTIQVYNGSSRQEARIARGKVFSVMENSRPRIQSSPPNYKVKVGKYFTRLEAQKDYVHLKKNFPNAIVIIDKIQINKN